MEQTLEALGAAAGIAGFSLSLFLAFRLFFKGEGKTEERLIMQGHAIARLEVDQSEFDKRLNTAATDIAAMKQQVKDHARYDDQRFADLMAMCAEIRGDIKQLLER